MCGVLLCHLYLVYVSAINKKSNQLRKNMVTYLDAGNNLETHCLIKYVIIQEHN